MDLIIMNNKLIVIALCASLISSQASAQLMGQVVAGEVDTAPGTSANVSVDSSGRLRVVGSAAGNAVYGPDASGDPPTQAPVLTAGQYNATAPTFVDGDVGTLQIDSKGSQKVNICLTNTTNCNAMRFPSADGTGLTSDSLIGTYNVPMLFNGTTWDRARGNTLGAFVQGNTASGSAVAGNPVLMGGSDGTNIRNIRTDSVGNTIVTGSIASGSTDGGNPVKVGAKYNVTLPTFTDGQRADLQAGARGSLNVQLMSPNGESAISVGSPTVDGANISSSPGLYGLNRTYLFNGSTWDRQRGDTNGAYVTGAKGSLTDGSGTITTGGTSQQVFAADADRLYIFCQNPSSESEALFINFGAAASTVGGSYELQPGASVVFEGNFIPSGTVNAVAATTGHAFTCKAA